MAGFTERRKQLKEKLAKKKPNPLSQKYPGITAQEALEQDIITVTSGKSAPRTSKRPKARPNRAADTKNVTKIGPY